jgi:hypothetical protein
MWLIKGYFLSLDIVSLTCNTWDGDIIFNHKYYWPKERNVRNDTWGSWKELGALGISLDPFQILKCNWFFLTASSKRITDTTFFTGSRGCTLPWTGCLYPSRIMLKLNPQWDGIWRWDLWEVIRSQGTSVLRHKRWFSWPWDSEMPVSKSVRQPSPDNGSVGVFILDSSAVQTEK